MTRLRRSPTATARISRISGTPYRNLGHFARSIGQSPPRNRLLTVGMPRALVCLAAYHTDMIKRILEISSEPYHVAVRLDQLTLRPRDNEAATPPSVPCEDVGVMVVDNAGVSYSHQALTRLLDFGAVVVLCGPNHLPAGLVLPLANHTEVVWRIDCQLSAKRPIKKRLWRQIVRAKIRNQAENLPADSPARGRLLAMVAEVRSGDPANAEAQAARIYWENWLDNDVFRRQPRSEEPINGMLNYGYAIVRAAVARALVSAGLFPPIGIHHCNRSNAFCLADDLLEPMRPWVDAVVADCVQRGQIGVNRDTKRELLTLLHRTVRVGGQSGPLMVGLHRMCASLVRCLEGTDTKLMIPRLVKGEEVLSGEGAEK